MWIRDYLYLQKFFIYNNILRLLKLVLNIENEFFSYVNNKK